MTTYKQDNTKKCVQQNHSIVFFGTNVSIISFYMKPSLNFYFLLNLIITQTKYIPIDFMIILIHSNFSFFLKILCPKRSSKFRISGNKYSIPKIFFHALLKPHIHLIIIQTSYIPRDFRIFLVHSNFPFCLKFFALNQVLNVEFSATSTRFRNFSYML